MYYIHHLKENYYKHISLDLYISRLSNYDQLYHIAIPAKHSQLLIKGEFCKLQNLFLSNFLYNLILRLFLILLLIQSLYNVCASLMI